MTGRRALTTFRLAVILAALSSCGNADASQEQKNLQLEVIINGAPSHMIGSFVLFDGKRIGATRNELADVGLDIGPRRFPEDIVILDDIPGLKYVYDEPAQTIRITVDNAKRRGQTFDVSGGGQKLRAQTGWGALLNYDFWAPAGACGTRANSSEAGASLTMDARAFSPYGTFEQSGIVNSDPNQASDAIRLNSTFEYSDQDNLVTYEGGDVIDGGIDVDASAANRRAPGAERFRLTARPDYDAAADVGRNRRRSLDGRRLRQQRQDVLAGGCARALQHRQYPADYRRRQRPTRRDGLPRAPRRRRPSPFLRRRAY